ALTSLARVAAMPPAAPAIPDHAAIPSGLAAGADYLDARRLVEGAGIRLAAARPVTTADDAIAAAEALGYPVVLKALGLLHKSDAGGVAVGLGDAGELREACSRMETGLAPPGYVVEQMVTAPVAAELIVGCRRDARFGPLVVVGLGGVYTEVLQDVV